MRIVITFIQYSGLDISSSITMRLQFYAGHLLIHTFLLLCSANPPAHDEQFNLNVIGTVNYS